mmetsp:Transcript_66198/g.163000  ORF Transcript_66198/g.163000 Transcript_66198/m.163000 type:complete len:145 (-) Transcript_66198:1180-1614(-)
MGDYFIALDHASSCASLRPPTLQLLLSGPQGTWVMLTTQASPQGQHNSGFAREILEAHGSFSPEKRLAREADADAQASLQRERDIARAARDSAEEGAAMEQRAREAEEKWRKVQARRERKEQEVRERCMFIERDSAQQTALTRC